MRTKFVIVIALFTCFQGVLTSFTAVKAEEGELVSLQFQTVVVGQPIYNLYYQQGEEYRSLVVTNGSVSRFSSYAGEPKLYFYRHEIGGDGNENYRAVAMADLSRREGNVILVFVPNPEENQSREYYVYTIDAAWQKWDAGGYLFFNLTGFTVAGLFGESDQRFVLEPGAYASLQPTADEILNERLRILVRDRAEWRMLYSSVWTLKPGRRAMVFITQADASAESINVRRIYQAVQQPARSR